MIFEVENIFDDEVDDEVDEDGSGIANGYGTHIATGEGCGYGDGSGYRPGKNYINGPWMGSDENMILGFTDKGLEIYFGGGFTGGHGNTEGIGYGFDEFNLDER